MVHTYIHLATVHLGIFDSWKGKRLESALAVANMLGDVNLSNMGYMHPVVAVSCPPAKSRSPMLNLLQKLLTVAARVLLEELKSSTADFALEGEVRRALESLDSILSIYATNCPYIGVLSQSLKLSERPTRSIPT